MVRELFEMARTKKACIVFFDEIDAIGGARFDDGAGGDNEVQRTMLELINQLDGFDPRGNIKVLMATNRPDTLDPALTRPGRLDRKVEFGLPDLEVCVNLCRIAFACIQSFNSLFCELILKMWINMFYINVSFLLLLFFAVYSCLSLQTLTELMRLLYSTCCQVLFCRLSDL